MNDYRANVPPWVHIEEPLDIDPSQIPRYFRPASAPPKPPMLEQRGRWGSVMNTNRGMVPIGTASATLDTEIGRLYRVSSSTYIADNRQLDPGILKEYNLYGKWVNTLDDAESFSQQNGGLRGLIRRFIADPSFRKKWIYGVLYSNPFLPIVFRGTATVFTLIALAVSCSVYVKMRHMIVPGVKHPESPAIMAIAVSTVSVCYLSFSLWDETFGQPLGLRRSLSKMKFVAGDIVLMCVMAANLGIAMEAIIVREYICPGLTVAGVCPRERTVVGFLFMSLLVWLTTVFLSVFRMVDRATH